MFSFISRIANSLYVGLNIRFKVCGVLCGMVLVDKLLILGYGGVGLRRNSLIVGNGGFNLLCALRLYLFQRIYCIIV